MSISILNTDNLRRRIRRLKGMAEKYDIDDAYNVWSYHGGFSHGYLVGQISTLEDLLDEILEGIEND